MELRQVKLLAKTWSLVSIVWVRMLSVDSGRMLSRSPGSPTCQYLSQFKDVLNKKLLFDYAIYIYILYYLSILECLIGYINDFMGKCLGAFNIFSAAVLDIHGVRVLKFDVKFTSFPLSFSRLQFNLWDFWGWKYAPCWVCRNAHCQWPSNLPCVYDVCFHGVHVNLPIYAWLFIVWIWIATWGDPFLRHKLSCGGENLSVFCGHIKYIRLYINLSIRRSIS